MHLFYLGSLPTLTSEYWKPTNKHYKSSPDATILDRSALDSTTLPPFPLGTTGSLAWNGDIESLRGKLQETKDFQQNLEYERYVLARKARSVSAQSFCKII